MFCSTWSCNRLQWIEFWTYQLCYIWCHLEQGDLFMYQIQNLVECFALKWSFMLKNMFDNPQYLKGEITIQQLGNTMMNPSGSLSLLNPFSGSNRHFLWEGVRRPWDLVGSGGRAPTMLVHIPLVVNFPDFKCVCGVQNYWRLEIGVMNWQG